ncbi:MAG: glucose-1-phosphate thymidylyltransferase [Prevotella sp.]|nr:glucose-1-phosphate thymidylyltransferase [Bacteroides sp.]MCM1366958.1 glucose-1-phosphate thymidylyltransferase [Prevotella sp.]MCM1436742.1 glucose-1-phosphate thymidylyltransferase [Prevotella sp.]
MKMDILDNIILFESQEEHDNLLPLSFTRPIADFRVGINTIRHKWESSCQGAVSYLPVAYLREKFPAIQAPVSLYIRGSVLPNSNLVHAVNMLAPGQALVNDGFLLAARCSAEDFAQSKFEKIEFDGQYDAIRYPFDIFLLNAKAIEADYRRIVKGRTSRPLPQWCTLIGNPKLSDGTPSYFIEEGAEILPSVINVTKGPIYFGKNSIVMEGATLRGPVALCRNAKIRMGAKIYEGSTFGPFCKVGGEVDNAVLFAFSNKAHDGYLGNAVIGEWCNIGAGVNSSNLKNDYTKIRIWNYPTHSFMRTDLQFCGLIMGDHSKAGINCMFNTATVVGVGVNIHGAGFPRTFIPSFSEGSPTGGFKDVPLKKFYQIAERVMQRRDIPLMESDKRIYEQIYKIASEYKHS